MNNSRIYRSITYLILIFIFTSCGHRKTATGGKVDNVNPEIVNINPFELESIAEGLIEVTFSKAIERTSILSGITIYPPILEKKFKWDGNTLKIQILEELETDTNYFFTFTQSIQGEHGNKLLKDYTYIFSSGELTENRISGNIIYEDQADLGSKIKLILQAADSTFIYSRNLTGTSYSLDYLNAGSHIIQTFIDKNSNNRYDYSKDPYFRTVTADKQVQTIDLEITYQDTIKPELIRAQMLSSTQVSYELSEPCDSFSGIELITADTLEIEIPVLASSLLENDLKILCEPLDTLDYITVITGLTDLKGNSNKRTELLISGITINDSIPPYVVDSAPRNGATLTTLEPEFKVIFSEIIYSSDLITKLASNEDQIEIPVEILQGDGELFIMKPVTDLQNYSTYTFSVKAVDPSGNVMTEELVKTFIPIVKEE